MVMTDEIEFPAFMHHKTVQKELTKLLKAGKITEEEGDRIYQEWMNKRKSKPDSTDKQSEFHHERELLMLDDQEFDKRCPDWIPPLPVLSELPPKAERIIRAAGPGMHPNRFWKFLGELLDQGIIEDPMLMADIYKVRQTAVSQMRSGKVKTVR